MGMGQEDLRKVPNKEDSIGKVKDTDTQHGQLQGMEGPYGEGDYTV